MPETTNKRIAENAALNAIKTILGIIFPLITFPYVTRVLGVEQIGIYTFSASIISYFVLIAALGVSTYGIREGTRVRDDKHQIEQFVSEVFSINIISTAVAYLLLGISLFFIPKLHDYSAAILILSIEIFVSTLGVAWVCNIYEDFLFITLRTLGFQVVSLILTFTLIKQPSDLYKYVCIVVLSSSGSNLVNYFYVKKKYCNFHFTIFIDWKKHLRPILVIFSATVAITVYVSSDATMLGFMTSDFEVGLYGTSVKIYSIIKNVLAALLLVLIPHFTLLSANNEKEKANQLFSRVFCILTIIMLPTAVGLFMLSEDIVQLVAGKDYSRASGSLQLLSIAILFSLYAFMYTQCILIPAKKENVVFKATAISAVVNICLNFVLIPIWGINAAALTTVISEMITFAISAIEGEKYVTLIGIKRNILSSLLGCSGIVAICFLLKGVDRFIIRVGFSVICSVVFYSFIMLLLNRDILIQLKGLIKNH